MFSYREMGALVACRTISSTSRNSQASKKYPHRYLFLLCSGCIHSLLSENREEKLTVRPILSSYCCHIKTGFFNFYFWANTSADTSSLQYCFGQDQKILDRLQKKLNMSRLVQSTLGKVFILIPKCKILEHGCRAISVCLVSLFYILAYKYWNVFEQCLLQDSNSFSLELVVILDKKVKQ